MKNRNPIRFRLAALLSVALALPWPAIASALPDDGAPAARARTSLEDTAEEAPGEETPDSSPDTQIRPGFLLQLSSIRDGKLSGRFRVQQDGTLQLPYSVRVSTRDLNLSQLESKVDGEYAQYFRGGPQMKIVIRQKRYWIEVGGLVGRPGNFLVKERSPLEEVISSAGGLTTDDANAGFVRIEQKDGVHWVDLDDYFKHGQGTLPAWRGGDRVFFQLEGPESASPSESVSKVQIMGEVRKPGAYTYQKRADGFYYLTATGGPTTFSDLEHVELIRTDPASGRRNLVAMGPLAGMTDIRESDVMIVQPVRPSSGEHTLTIVSVVTGIVTASLLAYVAVRGNR